MLKQLGFRQGFAGDDFGAALQLVSELQAGRRRKLPEQAPTGFLKPTWRKFVLGDQLSAEQQRSAYELAVLATLHDWLRSGDVYVAPSHRYADLNSYLIPAAEWEQVRPERCAPLGLPLVTTDRLTERLQKREDLLGPMKTVLDADGDVRLEAGQLVVTRPATEEVPAGAQALQQKIDRRLPAVDLTDILVEVNAWLSFTAHLPGLEHAPRGDEHDTRLLATLLATGCNIPLADMARSAALNPSVAVVNGH